MIPLGTQTPSRVTRRFAALRESGELGLVTFITAGDPNLATSERIVLALAEAGADVIELGVPFSDPLADGPAIQRSSERALRGATSLSDVIHLASKVRSRSEVPLVLFSYFNPVLQMGLDRFARAAASAAVDAALITDLTPEEADDYCRVVRGQGLDTIFLAAPTSTETRLKLIAGVSSGFLYLISRAGVTGARQNLPEDLPDLVRRARAVASLPLAVGFGISLPGHVSALGGLADAAVVGSVLVEEIERSPSADAAVMAVAARVQSLKRAAREGMSRRRAQP